jgi:succinate dehydrogenase / fumarate reductase cytochrome b subunit
MAPRERPTSPHLTIHPQRITGGMSIFHRITGVALAVGAFGIVAWLLAVAGEGDGYTAIAAVLASAVGKGLLVAFAAALLYHFFNGIRHLLWDIGWGYELPRAYASGYAVLALTAASTLALALMVWRGAGA